MSRLPPRPKDEPVHLNGLKKAVEILPWSKRVSGRAAHLVADPSALALSAPDGLWPISLAMVSESSQKFVVALTATSREAEDAAAALSAFVPSESVAVFPSWETLPHERLSPRTDTVGARLSILRRLKSRTGSEEDLRILLVPARALLQPLVKGLELLEPVQLAAGAEPGFDETVQALHGAAYARTDMVSRRGEYAVRGGIIDVFPPTLAHPVRVDFFGDEIESIREFAVADQRTIADAPALPAVTCTPCRELLITPAVQSRAAKLKGAMPSAEAMLEKIAGGIAVEGMESLAPLLVDAMVPLSSHFPAGTLTVVLEPEKVRARALDLESTNAEFLQAAWASAASGESAPVDLAQAGHTTEGTLQEEAVKRLMEADFLTLEQAREHALERGGHWWSIGSFEADGIAQEDVDVVASGAREPMGFRGNVAEMTAFVGERVRDGWTVVIATEGPGSAQRLVELFNDASVPAARTDSLNALPEPGIVEITTASAGRGYVFEAAKLAFLTEADLLGRRSPRSTKDGRSVPARRRRNPVDPLQLKNGDFVVHEQHGIGQFIELIQRSQGAGAAKTTREYLVVEYAASKRGGPKDRLFIPTDQLDQISKYVGGEAPTLSKMGGSDWASTTSKARRAVKEIAAQLIRLYSARMASEGHAFAPDTPWQKELEEAFPYIETPDQLTTINEVKADMEKPIPMDRLVSGDVGYGKTEIAVRAAFKAVQDGKQVAVLVPTTLLARQHFETFSERFAGFPVRVKVLSRFQTAKESRAIMEEVKQGQVDVLVGTHRLLSKEIQFKDLGLVIIDEEQRFGVKHKEELKKMRTNVDVLAMSATPIPRTLEMSLTGIRETSTLATPPEERHPVLTYVGPYTDKQVTAAIRRELMREGQVFYVHNRVSSIDKVAAHIQEMVPEARVEVAHGQMSEKRLEQLIVDFWEKKFDVLVCTTIVETGLDISNANTLIVDRADVFGLSQLHQLRGRVGRGRERAYAYLLYPAEKPLGEIAMERLKAVAAHNELGAGMQLAMKDLEIRGAGNLLGGEQSGHIAGVGFDLYLRLVGEAVADFRGEDEEQIKDVKIELPVNALLPHDYVPGERLRLEAYRKLAAASDEAQIQDVIDEITDRYGKAPAEVENLYAVARFRIAAQQAGITEVMALGPNIKFAPAELPESRQMRLQRLYPKAQIRPALNAIMVPKPQTAVFGGRDLVDGELLVWAHKFVGNIYGEGPETG